ncbi:hypothetical protein ACH34C_19195 [Elizabethkingia anophelis]
MNRFSEWKLPPVYDLTFSNEPGGEQSTMILEQSENIMLGVYAVAILFVIICGYIGIKNYEIGIKTKEEHREEFIQELKVKDNGKYCCPTERLI